MNTKNEWEEVSIQEKLCFVSFEQVSTHPLSSPLTEDIFTVLRCIALAGLQSKKGEKKTSKEEDESSNRKMKKEDTVKLISAEGFEFVVDKEAAMVSQTIHNMLTSPGSFAETQHGEVTFPEISTTILEKICQYFYWHLQFASGKETEFIIEPELTLELMMAANYLHT
ncbi:hypothetical protein L6164_021827 [Bauhinia variegata]|uniref:Uncharacterized protein n=1 Tax=Bauhinia variegata TaxID=167791 RepID=A0ACB9MD37_BAUVA|nr:hypothetical protein L6164_021827 [Bauhinia variegata]